MTSVEVRLSREDALAAARLHHLAYVWGRFCAVAIGTLTASYVAAILFLLGATRDGLTIAALGALIVPAVLYGCTEVQGYLYGKPMPGPEVRVFPQTVTEQAVA